MSSSKTFKGVVLRRRGEGNNEEHLYIYCKELGDVIVSAHVLSENFGKWYEFQCVWQSELGVFWNIEKDDGCRTKGMYETQKITSIKSQFGCEKACGANGGPTAKFSGDGLIMRVAPQYMIIWNHAVGFVVHVIDTDCGSLVDKFAPWQPVCFKAEMVEHASRFYTFIATNVSPNQDYYRATSCLSFANNIKFELRNGYALAITSEGNHIFLLDADMSPLTTLPSRASDGDNWVIAYHKIYTRQGSVFVSVMYTNEDFYCDIYDEATENGPFCIYRESFERDYNEPSTASASAQKSIFQIFKPWDADQDDLSWYLHLNDNGSSSQIINGDNRKSIDHGSAENKGFMPATKASLNSSTVDNRNSNLTSSFNQQKQFRLFTNPYRDVYKIRDPNVSRDSPSPTYSLSSVSKETSQPKFGENTYSPQSEKPVTIEPILKNSSGNAIENKTFLPQTYDSASDRIYNKEDHTCTSNGITEELREIDMELKMLNFTCRKEHADQNRRLTKDSIKSQVNKRPFYQNNRAIRNEINQAHLAQELSKLGFSLTDTTAADTTTHSNISHSSIHPPNLRFGDITSENAHISGATSERGLSPCSTQEDRLDSAHLSNNSMQDDYFNEGVVQSTAEVHKERKIATDNFNQSYEPGSVKNVSKPNTSQFKLRSGWPAEYQVCDYQTRAVYSSDDPTSVRLNQGKYINMQCRLPNEDAVDYAGRIFLKVDTLRTRSIRLILTSIMQNIATRDAIRQFSRDVMVLLSHVTSTPECAFYVYDLQLAGINIKELEDLDPYMLLISVEQKLFDKISSDKLLWNFILAKIPFLKELSLPVIES